MSIQELAQTLTTTITQLDQQITDLTEESERYAAALAALTGDTPKAAKPEPAKHTDKKMLRCDICGRTFKGAHGLAVHKSRSHMTPNLPVPAAFNDKPIDPPPPEPVDIPKIAELKRPSVEIAPPRGNEIPCPLDTCDFKTPRQDGLDRHLRFTHQLDPKAA
jgi:hypothetical protein